MIKVAVVGAGGRMGSLVTELIAKSGDMGVVAASEQTSSPLWGKRLHPESEVVVCSTDALLGCGADVVVDFTVPEVCMQTMALAKEARIAVVSGTTGLSEAQHDCVRETARHVPVLFSPNMSVGVHAFFRALASLAHQLSDGYDTEIVEMHHRFKQDAPSGTAKRMLELLARDVPCHSLRLGDVVGEHQVHFAGQGERITLTHHAESRETFARGALAAIRFVHGRAPGLYTMYDVLTGQA